MCSGSLVVQTVFFIIPRRRVWCFLPNQTERSMYAYNNNNHYYHYSQCMIMMKTMVMEMVVAMMRKRLQQIQISRERCACAPNKINGRETTDHILTISTSTSIHHICSRSKQNTEEMNNWCTPSVQIVNEMMTLSIYRLNPLSVQLAECVCDFQLKIAKFQFKLFSFYFPFSHSTFLISWIRRRNQSAHLRNVRSSAKIHWTPVSITTQRQLQLHAFVERQRINNLHSRCGCV